MKYFFYSSGRKIDYSVLEDLYDHDQKGILRMCSILTEKHLPPNSVEENVGSIGSSALQPHTVAASIYTHAEVRMAELEKLNKVSPEAIRGILYQLKQPFHPISQTFLNLTQGTM